MQPFNNLVVTVTLTGAQLKEVLEQQFAGYAGQTTSEDPAGVRRVHLHLHRVRGRSGAGSATPGAERRADRPGRDVPGHAPTTSSPTAATGSPNLTVATEPRDRARLRRRLARRVPRRRRRSRRDRGTGSPRSAELGGPTSSGGASEPPMESAGDAHRGPFRRQLGTGRVFPSGRQQADRSESAKGHGRPFSVNGTGMVRA